MDCYISIENYTQAPFWWKCGQNKTLNVKGKRCFLLIKLLGVLLRGSTGLRRLYLLLKENEGLSGLCVFS